MTLTKLLTAGLLVAGLALGAVPAAGAQPVPNPAPVPVPEQAYSAPSPLPAENFVPNINGYPCSGYWESTACYAMSMGDSPMIVSPRTSVSSSP